MAVGRLRLHRIQLWKGKSWGKRSLKLKTVASEICSSILPILAKTVYFDTSLHATGVGRFSILGWAAGGQTLVLSGLLVGHWGPQAIFKIIGGGPPPPAPAHMLTHFTSILPEIFTHLVLKQKLTDLQK